VHLNGFVHGALPWSAPVLVAGHSCVLSWWRAVHGCDAPPSWSRYRAAVTRGLHAAALVVAPTRAMLDALQQHYGALRNGRVIANGRDCEAHGEAHGEAPRGDREAFVLAAGRLWDEAKDMVTLAAAAPHIRWPVFVAGADHGPDGARHVAAGVHHLGRLAPSALAQWYRRCGIFVHPAVYEPFGLAPLEAAQAGAALVVSDIPSLREVWGDAATYVAPRDAAALADAVNRLVQRPALLAERAAAAAARARSLTGRAMAHAYHGAYLELAGMRTAAGEAAACAS
jgi:glycogen synthase